MKKFLFSFAVIVFFIGCSTSSVVLKKTDKEFFILSDKRDVLKNEIIKSNNLYFADFDLKQHVLKDDNNRILFYENVTLNIDYDFRYNVLNSINYIFDVKKATVLYNDNTLLLVQAELPLGEFLNILAYSNDMQNLSYVYGFSNYEFKKIAGELIKEPGFKTPFLTRQARGVNKDDIPLSRWSQSKLFIKPFTIYTAGRKIF